MPFQKGQSGNKAGKPKGAANKITKELREVVKAITDDYFNSIDFKSDIMELSAIERLKTMTKLMEFTLPKLTSIKTESTDPPSKVNIPIIHWVADKTPKEANEKEPDKITE